ncbi:MAG: hypothetical protein R2746_15345 [Acidimicrobiales bacterium]
MTTPTRPLWIAAAVAMLVVLAGCSSSGGEDAATTTTAAAETTTTEATTTTEEETTTTETDASDPAEKLSAFLLTADDLGPTFEELDPQSDGEGPCGGNVDDDYPSALKVQAAYQSDELRLAMQQDLRVYESEQAASTAFDGFVEAVSCGADTTSGTFELGEPTDVSDRIGQQATAVSITGDGTEGVGVVVLYSDLVATYQFQGVTGAAEEAGIASPLDITADNIGEIVDAFG